MPIVIHCENPRIQQRMSQKQYERYLLRQKKKEELKQYRKEYRQTEEYKEKHKVHQKKYREANKDYIREKKKEYYLANKEKFLQRAKNQYNKVRDTNEYIKYQRIFNWKTRGVICDYDAIYDIYINTHECDYCGRNFKNSQDRQLDHCHESGAVRGIICKKCNTHDVYGETEY